MKTKNLVIFILMITFILILGTKVEAAETIEKDQEYSLTQEINLKTLPLMFSREKSKIEQGTVKIVEILNDWCKVENSEETGWIRISNLKSATSETNSESDNQNSEQEGATSNNEESNDEEISEETTEELEVTEISKIGYVSADGLNIRKEPSTSSEIIHSLSFNSKVTITGEVDGWYRINYEDQVGYVSQKYISDERLPETTSRGGIDRTVTTSSSTTATEESTSTQEETTTESTSSESETTSTSSVTGSQIVEFAKQYIGYKYVAGGASPSTGFDCSGFTTYVFAHFGISLNRSSKDQIKNGVAVDKSNLQPGDLLIFNNEANTAIGHVGIYIGDGNFIHAANSKEGVKITPTSQSYYLKRYVGARRVI